MCQFWDVTVHQVPFFYQEILNFTIDILVPKNQDHDLKLMFTDVQTTSVSEFFRL